MALIYAIIDDFRDELKRKFQNKFNIFKNENMYCYFSKWIMNRVDSFRINFFISIILFNSIKNYYSRGADAGT